jgi:hypothetical protein
MDTIEIIKESELKQIMGGINEMQDKPIGDDCIV